MSQVPPMPDPMGGGGFVRHTKPHRGVLILVFGILGFVVCVIFGILAWVWGANDLREMDAGQMDPEGRGLTQAGKIVGMVSVILTLVVVVGWVLLVVLMGVGAGAASTFGG
jgi:amino acid transporter